MTRFPSKVLVYLVVGALVACTSRDDREAAASDSVASGATSVGESAAAAPAPADTGCRKTGDWQLCSVEDRLTRAGLIVERLPERAQYTFMNAEGVRFRLGAADDEVQIFIYPTQDARRTVTAALDSVDVSPPGNRHTYPVQPLLVTSNNMAAIILTPNPRNSERIALALSAGLPPR